MHFQFLIEDQSSAALIETLMPKIILNNPNITYNCKSFKGIGGFTKKNTVKETKSGKLLNDLATYLRGFNNSLRHIDSAIIVILDNDRRNTAAFRKELEDVALKNLITLDHVFCVAVEEVEAWLLGDEKAVMTAYPSAKIHVLRSYIQDSICGTWEFLADAIYPGGLLRFKQDCTTYMEIGKYKTEWARRIGGHMDLAGNKSPSFNSFLSEIHKRIPIA